MDRFLCRILLLISAGLRPINLVLNYEHQDFSTVLTFTVLVFVCWGWLWQRQCRRYGIAVSTELCFLRERSLTAANTTLKASARPRVWLSLPVLEGGGCRVMPLGFPAKPQNGIKPSQGYRRSPVSQTPVLLSEKGQHWLAPPRETAAGSSASFQQCPSAGTWALSLPRPPEFPRQDGAFGGVRVPKARRQLVLPLSWQRGESEDRAAHTPALAGWQLSQQLAFAGAVCAVAVRSGGLRVLPGWRIFRLSHHRTCSEMCLVASKGLCPEGCTGQWRKEPSCRSQIGTWQAGLQGRSARTPLACSRAGGWYYTATATAKQLA